MRLFWHSVCLGMMVYYSCQNSDKNTSVYTGSWSLKALLRLDFTKTPTDIFKILLFSVFCNIISIRLCNNLAEELLVGKYDVEIGTPDGTPVLTEPLNVVEMIKK